MAKTAAPKIDYPTTELGMLRAAIAEATERGDTEWADFLTGKLSNFGGTSEIPAQEIREHGNSNGDNSSAHRPAYSNLASEKQVALIIKLTMEKTGVNLELPERADMLTAIKNLVKKEASKTIDMLFSLPRFTAVQAEMRAKGVEPIPADAPSTEVAPVEADPIVLPGRYVVEGREIRVSQGKKGSQWFGTIFVRDIETDRNLRGEERLAVLKAIAANPAECALAYTQLTGRCTCCTRLLTNQASIDDAMGPICSGKFGRAYGFTILGEVYVEKPKRVKKAAAPIVIEAEVLEGEIVEPTPALPAAPVQETPVQAPRTIAKGTGVAKAEKVMAALAAVGAPAKLDTYAGVTRVHATVDGKALLVTWDGASFRYGEESTLGGKKFRNVSELLRLIG